MKYLFSLLLLISINSLAQKNKEFLKKQADSFMNLAVHDLEKYVYGMKMYDSLRAQEASVKDTTDIPNSLMVLWICEDIINDMQLQTVHAQSIFRKLKDSFHVDAMEKNLATMGKYSFDLSVLLRRYKDSAKITK